MNQSSKTYKDLKFWQTAKEASLLVVALTRKLPNERVAWVIIDQIVRSSFSIGANITEGYGKYKGKEYGRFIQIALGSARETEYWLEMLQDIYPKFSNEIQKIIDLNDQTTRMLVATVNTLRKS